MLGQKIPLLIHSLAGNYNNIGADFEGKNAAMVLKKA
jgi:hypothetical protein